MFKELFYASLGAAFVLKDRVEKEIKILEKRGKIKRDDAKSLLEAMEKKGKDEQIKIESKLKETIKKVMDEIGVATKDDLEKLKEELKDKS